jgi:transcriptional regulator with XRE-family HTH domain
MNSLRIVRLRAGLTQAQLAARSGVSVATLSAHERGLPLSLRVAKALARALKVRPVDLTGGDR